MLFGSMTTMARVTRSPILPIAGRQEQPSDFGLCSAALNFCR
jgi:hypothetical protein